MRRLLFLAPLLLVGCFSGTGRSYRSSCYDCCQRSAGDAALGYLIGAVFDELAHKDEKPAPRMREMPGESASPVYRSPRTGRVSTRVLIAGGHLKLIGMPEKSRDEVVLAVRPTARLDQECAVRLYRDGEPLTIGQTVRRTDHELLATLRIDELGASGQLGGVVCGQSFELSASGRDTIADFVARFHQRVDELSAPASTTVAEAR